MANTFQTTSKIEQAIAFQWKAFEGFADHLINRNDELPGAVTQTGYSKLIRRPSRSSTTVTGVAADYNLPGVTQPVVAYGNMTDATFPFTVNTRFEQNLQVSMEELMFKLTAKDAMDRFITPAIIDMRNNINRWIAQSIEAACGNTVITDGTADGYVKGLFDARKLMINRGGYNDGQDRNVIFSPEVMPVLGLGAAKIFQAQGADKTYGTAKWAPIAGFNIFDSPTLTTPVYASLGASAVVAAGMNVTALNTASWTPTTTVLVTGATASTTWKAGTKIKFTNGSTDNRWIVPTLGSDAGAVGTFTLTADATSDGAGAVTLVVSEPIITGGAFQNLKDALVAGSTKVSVVTAVGSTLFPSYAFGSDAVWLGFPEVGIPKGVASGKNLKLGGFNIAMVEDHWPGTLQNVVKLVAFGAIGVAKPEALVAIY